MIQLLFNSSTSWYNFPTSWYNFPTTWYKSYRSTTNYHTISIIPSISLLDIKKELLPTLVISVFAIFNIVHNGKAVVEEKNIPFTNAELAGQFIKEKIPEKVPIVAINKFEATPVIGYARRSFYELPDGVPFSYFRWVDKIYLPVENELKLFAKFKGVGGIVVLSPKPLDADRFPSLQLWQKWEDKNYKNENYYLYTLSLSGAREQKPVTPLE